MTRGEQELGAARSVGADLRGAGHTALLAGGCVRDLLLGRRPKDFDIATSATPDQIEALFAGHTIAVGKAFGVVVVRRAGYAFDVATFRTDGVYSDGRRPERISLSTPAEDAQRRDFTINGLFLDPDNDAIIDYVNGQHDLEKRVVRAIGSPALRFAEDHLRMLRAIRFSSVLEFTLEPATRAAINDTAASIVKVSPERVATEITRMLCEAPRPSVALELLFSTGLLQHTLPEVEALRGIRQPPQFHPEGDVWKHTCLMLDEIPPPRSPALAWSLLLHDIGKPATTNQYAGDNPPDHALRFPNHAPVGAEMARSILKRLRQPTVLVEQVASVVNDHMRLVEAPKMRPARLRRLLGAPTFPLLLEVMRADSIHSNGDLTIWNFLNEALAAYQSEPALPEALVRGRDLLDWGLGRPGPQLGELLRILYDAQLEGHFATRAEALEWLRRNPPGHL